MFSAFAHDFHVFVPAQLKAKRKKVQWKEKIVIPLHLHFTLDLDVLSMTFSRTYGRLKYLNKILY